MLHVPTTTLTVPQKTEKYLLSKSDWTLSVFLLSVLLSTHWLTGRWCPSWGGVEPSGRPRWGDETPAGRTETPAALHDSRTKIHNRGNKVSVVSGWLFLVFSFTVFSLVHCSHVWRSNIKLIRDGTTARLSLTQTEQLAAMVTQRADNRVS